MADLLQLCGSFNQLLLVAFQCKGVFLISVTLLLLLKLEESCLLPLLYVISLSKQFQLSGTPVVTRGAQIIESQHSNE